MLKKFVLGGVAMAAFAGVGLAAPALADAPPPRNENDVNVAEQSGNVIVCGNHAIGDIVVTLLNLAPVTTASRQPVDCSITVHQRN
ncbi:hypothetical protein HNP84_009151 [Thermocatellispora tengchongensis]|uniref:Secreted protein n=1 Tax=Thermocatellispora tengchongensis TaxID=1073253 RepID=A0A840PIM0_9ACTN|nr:hypothetical protein [Thermocatellispora tengchongensis]MBB5139388.1 hypothetical protein [Thermocatellispora tengchongensis]